MLAPTPTAETPNMMEEHSMSMKQLTMPQQDKMMEVEDARMMNKKSYRPNLGKTTNMLCAGCDE